MKLYLDGLERSGNVYLSYLLGFSLGLKIDSLRTHHLSTLIEYKGSEPFIVPVRDALPSLVSAKVYRDYVFNNKLYGDYTGSEAKIERILERYKEYTDYLLDNPQFFIAPFDAFTKDHEVFVDKLIKFYSSTYNLTKRKMLTSEEILIRIKESGHLPDENPHMGNLPREEALEKKGIESLLKEQYSEQVYAIQENINKLYERYNSI